MFYTQTSPDELPSEVKNEIEGKEILHIKVKSLKHADDTIGCLRDIYESSDEPQDIDKLFIGGYYQVLPPDNGKLTHDQRWAKKKVFVWIAGEENFAEFKQAKKEADNYHR
jgi:hypothetical protein